MHRFLVQVDKNRIADTHASMMLVATVRNELSRLPYWLSYYRDLGIGQVFFVDDHSTDGTTDYLLAQPDSHVFQPRNSYSESNYGTAWQNELLDLYGEGRWTVVADADELLAYPDCENLKLPEFCALLDKEGSEALYCFLLDMYPDGDLRKAICERGKPFYEICDYFDSEYTFVKRLRILSDPALRFPDKEVIGGPRLRKFYPEQINASIFNRVKNRLISKACNKLTRFRVSFRVRPHNAPALFKVPLLKWRKGYARLSSHNITEPAGGISSATGVLLHFKFFADFNEKAKLESARGEHYAGGLEYKRYLNYIARDPHISFMYRGSVKYTGTASVMEHGLISSGSVMENGMQ